MASAWLHRLFGAMVALLAVGALTTANASADTAPSNSSPPTISTASGGEPAVGQTLVASAGSWSGSPSPSYTYEWYQCDSSGAGCADTNHSGTTYPLSDADYGHEVEVLVTAGNSGGSASVMSAPVYIAGSTPTVVDAPTLSGGTAVGDTLTATSGTWSGYPSPQVYAYTWWDCPSNAGAGSDCTQSTTGGSDSATYTLTAADAGHQVKAEVFVDNGQHASAYTNLSGLITTGTSSATGTSSSSLSGSSSGSSGSTATTNAGVTPFAPQLAGLPRSLSAPRIRGTVAVGRTLRASHGAWSGSPTRYAYSWWDCRRGQPCRRIPGATRSHYRVVAADAGQRLAVQIVALTSAGSSSPARSGLTRPCRAARRVR